MLLKTNYKYITKFPYYHCNVDIKHQINVLSTYLTIAYLLLSNKYVAHLFGT